MLRRLIITTCLIATAGAHAQTAVRDSAHYSQETGITDCTTAIKKSNQDTVAPTRGVKGSVATQGGATGAPTQQVGSADLTGGAGQGVGEYAAVGAAPEPSGPAADVTPSSGTQTPSAAVIASFGNVGGIDLSPLLNVQGAGVDIGNTLQVVKAGLAVANALQGNNQTVTAATAAIGTINTSHGGWDQNSAARVAQTAAWNQVLQAATTSTQLRNQHLFAEIRGATALAALMHGK